MLKQLILENWKSFRYAELPLDPLTVLIGTNASGKSNVIEALEFLQRIIKGEDIEAALAGDKNLTSIRGGVEGAALKPGTQFTLKALVQGEDDKTDYLYSITIQTKPFIQVLEEYVTRENNPNNPKQKKMLNYLFRFALGSNGIINTSAIFTNENTKIPVTRNFTLRGSMLTDLKIIKFSDSLSNEINTVIQGIENIFSMNPMISKMRDYSRLSESLETDTSNLAGVLAALPDQEKAEVESTLSTYIKELPEGDIKKVWAEKVGRFGTDAMLYCVEEWKPGHITEIDARTMSDGTLRFIAILTALLTRPEGSQLVIEEIDNGLHPSRAELLVKILREIGSKRKIDILLTTHNPALLDALGPEIVPFVVVAHRDKESGESKLTLLEDIENLPILLASGSLGRLATKGAIEKSLSDKK
jgi:predicted ATPase